MSKAEEQGIRSARFRKGREKSWKRLEDLLSKLEKKGARSLTADEAMELPGLYQTAISSLSLARNMILDRRLLMYLENLAARAYIAAYGPRETFVEVSRRFVVRDFPRAARNLRFHALAALVFLAAGFLSGYMRVGSDLNNYYDIVPETLAPVHPSDSREEILQREIFHAWPGFRETFIHFATFLFRNNSKVALLSFSLSFALGVPTVAIVYRNGAVLGAMISLHAQKGLAVPYIAWLSIHGVTELLALLLASAAGLSFAHAIVLPGPVPRREALSRAGTQAGAAMLGAVMMLFIAAIIEGGFRQLVSFTAGRALFALATALFWLWYLVFLGRDET
jgi:uncharacterized membrane protein SpoIIM required for sporulation